MDKNEIKFDFQARYFTNEVSPKDARQILFVFHGYGQLGEYFIRKFSILSDRNIRVVALEGLSHYYLQGSSGRVGASWMTRENRLIDIENYLTYSNKVYEAELKKCTSNVKISALGFSQGAATVSRWATQAHIRFDRLLLWAGLFPPDLDIQDSSRQFEGKEVFFVYGKQDPYLNDERFVEQQNISKLLGVEPTVKTFDGQHEIDSHTLDQLFSDSY